MSTITKLTAARHGVLTYNAEGVHCKNCRWAKFKEPEYVKPQLFHEYVSYAGREPPWTTVDLCLPCVETILKMPVEEADDKAVRQQRRRDTLGMCAVQ
jgi:hypothetical protein